ncbi:MAG: hypothetical protein UT84_C0004G0027 [Candidatus Curtissbacteria bacterium GW2011_GWA1_40_16]|uniref:Uncharacterized protein n=1 Tax=Candidatus Curtissbacteria bacterium GW2011_GWA1_40_16 TaxID=1618405 RepID=A0A0G0RE16_9BACT|nr:MAG: hypothetical protein UT84_C0004G0027 [Candidatus Curtissbacteria bacterium GW2011_GWA1_40_16]
MINKSIIKLIDEAILPAMSLVVAKMLGILLSAYFLNIPFEIKSRALLGILPAVSFANAPNYITAENYSNLAMFLVAALGTTVILIRVHFFHESHIHPNLQAKLASLNLESIIAPSYHLYHQALIWLIFVWMIVGFLVVSTLLKITYPQISILAFILAANLSWIFAIDVEKEIEITRSVQ